MKEPLKPVIYYHLPFVAYAVLIYIVSSVHNLPSPQLAIVPLDKFAHFLEYAVFAALTFRSFSRFVSSDAYQKAAFAAVVFLVGFAVLDEYHQRFVPGRSSDSLDIVADTLGATLVLVLLWLRRRRGARAGSITNKRQGH